MYRAILRPILFVLKPETVHHIVVAILKALLSIPFVESIFKNGYRTNHTSLQKEVFGLKFSNPVGLAAGFDKNATFFKQFAAFGFSFIEVGTVTPVGQPGNPKPRSFRLKGDKALINRMGFNNHGADRIAGRLGKRRNGILIGGNIGKNTSTDNKDAVADYARCFSVLYDVVDYLVINVSCPNITDLSDLQDRELLSGIMARLTEIRSGKDPYKPLLVKISPDLTDKHIDDVLELVQNYGLDGIVATNTTITRDNLTSNSKHIERIGSGGLSGRPLRARSTEVIRYIHDRTGGKLPIIGVGGIMSPEDAIEKLEAGAALIQVYTGFIYDGPGLVKRINRAILRKS